MRDKIKVLHTFNIMNRGGAETLVMNVFKNIDKDKIEFDFLCEQNKKGDFDDEIFSLGGQIFHLKQNKKRPIKNIINIIKFLKKNGPYDVIHLPNMFYAGIFCISAKLAGIPKIIVHSHNAGEIGNETIHRKFYKTIMRFLINHIADYKISCGNDAAIFLFGTTKNVLILNNGIDLKKFGKRYDIDNLKEEFNITDEKIIGNIARFSPEKNPYFFIKLGNYVKNKGLNYKILLIGDGKLRDKIKNEILKNNLEDIILCTGLRSDIPQILNIIDVIVMPSFNEGFPTSVIESLSSGTPCVLSDSIDVKTAIIPQMVSFVNLNSDLEVWINKIESSSKLEINLDFINEELFRLGFDIKNTTNILEKIYLDKD